MSGKDFKKKFPKYAERNNIQDSDYIYLAGDKIKILRKGGSNEGLR